MMWIAVIYSFVAMGLTHLVGRPLVPINFNRQRVEADFRDGLVRFRESWPAPTTPDTWRRPALG